MKRLAILSLLTVSAFAQHLVPAPVFNAIAGEYSGEQAQENTRRIIQYHRIQGSPMMAEVAETVVLPKLKADGLEASIEQFTSDGKTTYGTFISPMGWEIRSGELWVESVGDNKNFQPIRLCRYADVPMCVSTYSKGGEWSGELVDLGKGTSDADYTGKDIRGKVALAYGYAANVVREAVIKRGAFGVVIYPAAADRPDHPDMVRYNGTWTRADELEKTSGGFQISRNQYEMLRSLMQQGPVRVRGKIDATLGAGKLTLVHAYIRGTQNPDREILITAHLDHPKWSANDNASGSGAMMELARTLHTLIAAGKIPAPRLTIHFMWVPEYFGSMAYIVNHPTARRCGDWDDPRAGGSKGMHSPAGAACIVANINLDMVGEDTVKTGSRFYFTRTPDSVPSFLNALLADAADQTREAGLYASTGTRNYWQPESANYVQGSDHDVFIALGIPSSMFGHDPDWTHHTSEDKLDKTDASEFRRVGVFATATAWWESQNNEAGMSDLLGSYDLASVDAAVFRQALAHASGAYTHRSSVASKGKPKRGASGAGPHRLVVLPYSDTVFAPLFGDDKKWLDEQSERFSSDSEGLATTPTFALLVFETVNLMDGRRSKAEIADMLSAEYLIDLDEAWVSRVVSILAKLNLVSEK